MSHRLRPAIAALVILVTGAMLSACGDHDKTGETSSPKAGSTSAGPTLTKSTFFTALTAAQLKAGSAHTVMAISAGGQTIRAEGDMKVGTSAADNQVSMTMDAGAAGFHELKMVLINGALYMNFGTITGGKYAKLDLKDKNNPFNKQFGQLFDQMDPSTAFKQYKAALTSIDKVGVPVDLDGVKTQPYKMVLDTSKIAAFASLPDNVAKNLPANLAYVVYVGPDNLVRRLKYEVAGSTSEINYSKWGEPVRIEAPAPGDITTQDLSSLFGAASKSA